MKKILRPKHLPLIVLIASVLGLLLRLWTIGSGPSANGLYEPKPFAWVLLWIVTALTLGVTGLVSARLKTPGRYTDNFPASVPGAIGTALAALGILVCGMQSLLNINTVLDTLTGILGLVSGVAMVLAALARLKGQRPSFLFHALACVYLALRAFNRCQSWSNEPQIGVFIFPFLASLSVMLAAYQRTCFDVDLGKRRSSLFWSMAGVYFCILALPSGGEPVFYICMALWLLTNLCSLRPMNKRKSEPETAPAEAAAEAPEEDQPVREEAIEPQPEPQETTLREDMSFEDLKQWLEQQ